MLPRQPCGITISSLCMLYIPQASSDVHKLLQAQDAMAMQLSSITQCKTFLTNALELLASLLRETPAMCSALMPANVIHATVDLIAHGGFTVGDAIHLRCRHPVACLHTRLDDCPQV